LLSGGMLNTRDSRGTGYMLAIIGVAAALVVVIIGASTIAALNLGVPKELWAIGGALGGALVGILAPPPRAPTSGKEEAPLSVAAEAAAASNDAARERARQEDNAGKAVTQGAQRGLHAVSENARATRESVESASDDAPGLSGSSRDAANGIAASFESDLEHIGSSPPDGPADPVPEAERAIHEAAARGAREAADEQPDEQAGADAARGAAIAAVDAAERSAEREAQSHAQVGRQMGVQALAAVKQVEAAGRQAEGALLTAVPLGQADSAGARPAQHAAVTVLSAQRQLLAAQPAPVDKAAQAATNVHDAAVDAATKVADAAAPAGAGWLSGLRAIMTEPKIIVPLLLFAVTISLGTLLGLGVIHVAAVCKPAVTPAKESLCSHYANSELQASSVLISLAAATVGALVGIFAGHPGEQATTSSPRGG
jgi:hypothetical protein